MTGGVGARRSVRYAAVATAALVAGLLPGQDSAASGGAGNVSLGYACAFPSGAQDVTAQFSQQFPAAGSVGIPVRPGKLTLAVAIPRAGATALLPAGAASVTAAADLTAHITEGTSSADAHWSALAAPATAVPGDDALVLELTGAVPGVEITAPGQVAFAAGAFTLTLHPQSAPSGGSTPPDGSGSGSPSPADPAADPAADAAADAATPAPTGTPAATPTGTPSAPTTPSDITGVCTPKPGQNTTLGTVPVKARKGAAGSGSGGHGGPADGSGASASPGGAGGNGSSAAGSSPGGGSPDASRPGTVVPLDAPIHSGITTCGATPHGALDPKRFPPHNPGAIVLPFPNMPPFPDAPQCGFVVGLSNIAKLNGATIVNDPYHKPALAEINSGRRKVLDFAHQYVEVDSIASLILPPSHAAFLTYGFMPTTADVDFVQRGVMTIVQSGDDFFHQPILTTIGGYQDIRIHNVRMNGTPLDVGPNCHTARPVDIVLKGRKDAGLPDDDGKPDYDIADGGPLTDLDLVIPPFTGCVTGHGHGENLDALFTAALSGPGNTLNFVQGRLCDPLSAPQMCQPEIQIPPLPRRKGVHPGQNP